MPISPLPPEVVAQIAAGEVIERPASVVKELVENALDAGASRISVEVRNGGIDLVEVVDDGCGIEPEELELAFARYATSKLRSLGDLSCIVTLGFRGEALASISAVAEVELASRPPHLEHGAWVKVRHGKVVTKGWRGMSPGTHVRVRELFKAQPARRKFLRSPQAEARAVAQVMANYALAYPHVSFSLTLDARPYLHTPGSGQLREAVASVYDADLAAMLVLVDGEDSGVRVQGLVSPPGFHKGTPSYISLFVNGRWVKDRRLPRVLEAVYQGLLPSQRYPVAILNIWIPPAEVDVNVHPAKAYVRFRDDEAVARALVRVVRQALVDKAGPPQISLASSLKGSDAQASARGEGGQATRDALPTLQVVGQVGRLYVVAEGPDGMYLIDQHAAHERILYEELLRQIQARRPALQSLLTPLVVQTSPGERGLIEEWLDHLRAHGFELEALEGGAYLLRAIPQILAGRDPLASLFSVLEELPKRHVQGDRVAAVIACHAAVRAGDLLSEAEMRELVRRLALAEVPHTCPHGRPTLVRIGADDLARHFGRR